MKKVLTQFHAAPEELLEFVLHEIKKRQLFALLDGLNPKTWTHAGADDIAQVVRTRGENSFVRLLLVTDKPEDIKDSAGQFMRDTQNFIAVEFGAIADDGLH